MSFSSAAAAVAKPPQKAETKEPSKETKETAKDAKAGEKTVTIAPTKPADGKEKVPALVPYVREAMKALQGSIYDAILDIRVSTNEHHEQELARNGYIQLLQEGVRKANATAATFPNRASLWIWRRSQGTCSGRLKPIIDVYLDNTSASSELVLAGYTCDPVSIAGQSFWIKRATTEEEEKDALIDLYVTSGKIKDTSDPLWQSPGVGWVRVDGNFSKSWFGRIDSFLWYLPARTRAFESQLTNPIKTSVALTEEVRQTKLIAAVRLSLRHYVPVNDIKRLSNLVMENNQLVASHTATELIRSERMMDFSSLYHRYSQSGRLYHGKWSKMLHDIGIRLKSADITSVFHFFDSNTNGFISIEEFTNVLALTDYELDLALDKIRLKLLLPCIPKEILKTIPVQIKEGINTLAKTNIGVIGGQHITHPYLGKNKIRESMTLLNIFNMINVKKDNILSLDEMMDLAAKIEVFITEEEARKLLLMIDIDGDDRVEEHDFIAFMRKDSICLMKKAFRIREAATFLRRWLVRGTSEKIDNLNPATASKAQWKGFKQRYMKSTGKKFPGYLSAPILQTTLANLGLRLSAIESRELTLMVAPEKSGRIHLAELHAFMGRSCRSIGELVAIFERDIFHDLVDSYRAHQAAIRIQGREDNDLALMFKKKMEDIKKVIENVFLKPTTTAAAGAAGSDANGAPVIYDDDDDEEIPTPINALPPNTPTNPAQADPYRFFKGNHEVISISHLRSGLLDLPSSKKIPETLFPNQEEIAVLAILVDADIAEGDIYGIKLKSFLEGLCSYILIANEENRIKAGEKVSLDIISRDLKLQIYREARASSFTKKPDYKIVFDLFDENHNGTISLDEFKTLLKKLQLISSLSDHQIPMLLAMFDKNKRGVITYDDFKQFAEDGEKAVLEEDQLILRPPIGGSSGAGSGKGGATGSGAGGSLFDTEDDLTEEDLKDDIDLISDVPPMAVTRNADCDWFLWFLYRQACVVEPVDPEAVITELESACHETEMTIPNRSNSNNNNNSSRSSYPTATSGLTIKDFWNLLFEFRLQGNITKVQYIKGIQLLCETGNGKDDDYLDYNTLCKYIIRMGRGYMSLLQEKRKEIEKNFIPLLLELKKYFQTLCAEIPADKKDEIPRYEKIFRRLDNDFDGMLTPREFKLGLKRLHYKDYKAWTMPMVRRLFDECDKNKDGLLSIKEFNLYILDKVNDKKAGGPGDGGKGGKSDSGNASRNDSKNDTNGGNKLDLSDEEGEDDEVFRKHRTLTDHELMQKINRILLEIVPNEFPNNPQKHLEMVRSSVRRFFLRADPEYKGYVSEERFRAFLRRSSLQDRLTASELRRFTEKLKRKGVGRDRFESLIDYEKLCHQLLVVTESIPKSKAEVVFTRLQDAAIASASAGRSFMNLCTLIDLRLTGFITKEELIHTAKMMDYPMNAYDIEALSELLPSHAISKDNTSINYQILNNLLQTYSPREHLLPKDLDYFQVNASNTNPRFSTTGALPAYATPGQVTLFPPNPNSHNTNNATGVISTPLGYTLSSPSRPGSANYDNIFGTTLNNYDFGNTSRFPLNTPGSPMVNNQGNNANASVYDKILKALVERIKIAIQEKNIQLHGPNHSLNNNMQLYSLRKRCENNDLSNSGLITIRGLQYLLEELAIVLSTSELHVILHYYGKSTNNSINLAASMNGAAHHLINFNEESIFYDSFCRLVENTPLLESNSSNNLLNSSNTWLDGSLNNPLNQSIGGAGGAGGAPSYLSNRVLQRYRELKSQSSSRNPREFFEIYDLERNGRILATKFKEIITKTQLLQTEFQLTKAMEDFSAIGNRSYINYDDFLEAIEKAIQFQVGNVRDSRDGNLRASSASRGRGGVGIADGTNGYDGFTNDLYDSYDRGDRDSYHTARAGSASRGSNRRDHYPIELENGSDSNNYWNTDYALSPPKVTDSLSLPRRLPLNSPRGNLSPQRTQRSTSQSYDYGLGYDSARKSLNSSSIQVARTSPSKIGSKMWGNETPLPKKGKVPIIDDEHKWCCAVCLYIENPSAADRCLVCDSPNYTLRKDYQVKEQCRNCTFLNGQFAEECEMCGEPLSHHSSHTGGGAGGGGNSSNSAGGRYSNSAHRY